MEPDARTHYQVLGVSPSASQTAIREAYLNLARLLHPDTHVGAGTAERRLAERRMREVNAAWSVLREPTTRLSYDRSLAAAGEPRPPHSPSAPPSTAPRSGSGPRIVHGDDLDQLDPDEVAVSRATYHLITKGPLLVIAALALIIFVFSAYAKDPVPDPTLPGAVTTALPEVDSGR